MNSWAGSREAHGSPPGTGVPFDAENLQPRTTTVESSGPLVHHWSDTGPKADLFLIFANTERTGDELCTISFASTTVCKISHLPDGCVSLKSEWSSEVDKSRGSVVTDIAQKDALAHLGVADLFKVNDIATVRGRISVRGKSPNWACTSGTFGFNMNGGSLDVSVHHNTGTGDSGSDFVDVVVTDEMTYLVTHLNDYKWGVIGGVAGGTVNCKVEVEDMTICRPGHELKVAPCEYAEADSLSLLQCDGSPTQEWDTAAIDAATGVGALKSSASGKCIGEVDGVFQMVGCASGASATEFVVDASTAGLLRTTADDQLCFDEGGGRGGSERTVCAADGLECPVDGSDICYSKETVDWWETCESLGGAELTPDECAGASDVLGWPKRGGVPSTFDFLPRGCVVNLIKEPHRRDCGRAATTRRCTSTTTIPTRPNTLADNGSTTRRQLLCKRTTGQKCYTSHEKPSFYLNRTVEGGWIPDGPRKHCRWKMEGSAIVAKDITSASGASLCLTANGDKTTASPDQYFSWRPHPAHPDRGYPTKCTDEVFTCVGAICYTKHQAHDHLTTCSTFDGAADLTLDECKNAAATLGLPVAADSWQGDEGWTNLPKGCVGNLGFNVKSSQKDWVYYNLPGPEVHADITAGRHLFCKKPPQMRCDEEYDAATNEPRGYVLEKPYGYRASYPQGAATWLKLQQMDGGSGGRWAPHTEVRVGGRSLAALAVERPARPATKLRALGSRCRRWTTSPPSRELADVRSTRQRAAKSPSKATTKDYLAPIPPKPS